MKTVNYLRISTLAQDLERQEDSINKWNTYKGNEVVKVFVEKESGTKNDRVQLQELLNYCADSSNGVEQVVIDELSRFSRTRFLLEYIEKLSALKINLYSIKEGLNTLNEDKSINVNSSLLTGFLSSINSFELSTMKHRMKSGKKTAVKNGSYWGGSKLPFGYDNLNSKLVINENDAELVRFIFNEYINTKSFLKVSNILNSKGLVTNQGNSWSDTTLNRMLKNSIYIGKLNYKGEVMAQPQLQIIDNETFEKVQYIIETSTRPSNNLKHNYKLDSSLIICGCCGRNYTTISRPNLHLYTCLTKRYANNSKYNQIECNSTGISVEKLTSSVELMLSSFLQEIVKKNIDTTSIDLEINNAKNEIEVLNKIIKNTINEESKLVDLMLTNSNLSKDIFNNKLNEIIEKRAKANKSLSIIKNKVIELEALKESKYNMPAFVAEVNEKGMSKELLGKIITSITIYPSSKKLTNRKNDNAVEVHIKSGDALIKFLISPYSKGTYLTKDFPAFAVNQNFPVEYVGKGINPFTGRNIEEEELEQYEEDSIEAMN